MLGVCVIPARATTYDFDFHFDALDASYPVADIVFTTDDLSAASLSYVSGSVNGYAPTSVEVLTGNYAAGHYFYAYQAEQLGLPDGVVAGFRFSVLPPTGPGVYPTYPGANVAREIAYANGDGLSYSYTGGNLTVTEVATTPEPSSLMLLGTGVLGAAGAVRRRFA